MTRLESGTGEFSLSLSGWKWEWDEVGDEAEVIKSTLVKRERQS